MSSLSTAVHQQYSCTDVQADHLKHEWIIRKFRLLPEENEQCLWSPNFHSKENDRVKWKLQLYPKGQEKGQEDYVGLYLHVSLFDPGSRKIKAHCELSIWRSNDIKFEESFVYTFEGRIGNGYQKAIKRSELLSPNNSDDSIIIRCKIDIPQRTITKLFNPVSFDAQRGQLNEHFAQLLEDSRFSDVTIIVEEEKFAAHKLVLAARSPVFAAMFEHREMDENRKNEVKIEDLQPATVKGLLEFMYTDKVTDLEILGRELLKASDKYDLGRLRVLCEEVIYKTLTSENAAETLVLCDLYHSHKLKEYVMAFIDDNLLDVMQSESYISMMETYPALVNELMFSFATQRKSKARNIPSQ